MALWSTPTLEKKIGQRLEQIRSFQYIETIPIEDMEMREVQKHEGYAAAIKKSGFKKVKVGQSWGKPWSTAWIKMRFELPSSFTSKPAVARLNTGGECCCYLDGVPWQGIDQYHDEIRLTGKARKKERYELVLECGANDPFGRFKEPVLKMAEIASVDEDMKEYYWDCYALFSLYKAVPKEGRRSAMVLRGLNQSIDCLLQDGFDPAKARARVKEAQKFIRPLLSQPSNASELTLSTIGHAHIDVAWLWPLQETIRKCSRTFSTVVKYMDEYPDYKFVQSMCHLYRFARDNYPKLYEKMKKWVKAGRWEVCAAMWVEPDMNLIGGESMVRQLLLAKEFTRNEFGTEADVLWLPDVFGYSAALPQVLKKAGVNYFATIKISWNETNPFPYHTFWWEGIDGTRILSHFPPGGDYNAQMEADQLRQYADRYLEKDRSDAALHAFGWGDGGGGPAPVHLELARRFRDCEGLPKTKMQGISDFFHELEKGSEELPNWRGELYLETHRGTYTTQAEVKRNNRESEILYREAEFAASLAYTRNGKYPREKLNDGWRTILLNQFHDILPGSSIGWVYKDSRKDFEDVRKTGEKVLDDSVSTLAEDIDTHVDGKPVLVLNSLAWQRKAWVEMELPKKDHGQVLANGNPVPTYSLGKRLVFQADIPSMGYRVYCLDSKRQPEEPKFKVNASKNSIENTFLSVRFGRDGTIQSILDRTTGREVVEAGKTANVFQRFQDRPTFCDAWNIDDSSLRTAVDITGLESSQVADLGPRRAGVRQVRRFGKSTIEQTIWLEEDSPLLHFDTEVDWHEDYQLLKVAFPLDLHASEATYEIQWGNVRRSTTTNTSWDRARFEVCAHKWMDISEPDYGVALFNHVKFGHDVVGSTVRLTLLKSPDSPDPDADRGRHRFRYALMPHAGDYREAGVIRRAYEFAMPVTARIVSRRKGSLPAAHSFLSVDAPNVMIETVKKEEEGSRMIVRLYEAHGKRSSVTLSSGLPLEKVTECNLLEREHGTVRSREDSISFEIKPFEIRSFALEIKGG